MIRKLLNARAIHALFAGALFSLMLGCSTPKAISDPIIGPGFRATNVFSKGPISASIRRVAILPISINTASLEAAAGKRALEPILSEELSKSRQFDVVHIQPQQIKAWTGHDAVSAEEVLPQGFLTKIRESVGADAIAFVRLTHYRPYPPVAIGWKMRIVESTSGDAIWAIDEVFDSSDPTVVNAARRYQRKQPQPAAILEDSRSILLSPSRFGRYTLQETFETLPPRS